MSTILPATAGPRVLWKCWITRWAGSEFAIVPRNLKSIPAESPCVANKVSFGLFLVVYECIIGG